VSSLDHQTHPDDTTDAEPAQRRGIHPAGADIMRALVKETLSAEHVDTVARDIEEACVTLEKKGGAHLSEHQKMVCGRGH
jgi:hypothetical protein